MKDRKTPTIGGKTISEWNTQWTTLTGGFVVPQSSVRGQVGLFCAVLGDKRMYIGCSTARTGGKLSARIASFRNAPQSLNEHHGAQQIRKRIHDLELEVIVLGNSIEDCRYALRLKYAMIAHHQPPWNVLKAGWRV